MLEGIRRSSFQDRIQSRLDELNQIGRRPSGGVFRGVYDPAWREARDLIAGWFRSSGLEVRSDAVGNVWGRLAGREIGPSFVSGSHFDSVPDGGMFDGPLGIVGALGALEVLREDHGQPRRTLEVLALAEEEGSRFRAGFWASRAILGTIEADEPDRHRDVDGISLAEAMTRAGLDPTRVADARRDDIAAFIELHVEQDRGSSRRPAGTPAGVRSAS